jgi:hypothetical protein
VATRVPEFPTTEQAAVSAHQTHREIPQGRVRQARVKPAMSHSESSSKIIHIIVIVNIKCLEEARIVDRLFVFSEGGWRQNALW